MLAHLLRRHMAGIDRRISGSEERDQRRLRLLQMKGRLVIAVGGDPIEVPVPRFARVDAELGSRLAEQHVPGALDVLCGKRLPVVPANALAQAKGQFRAVLVPRPAGGEIRHDRLQCVLRHMLVEDDEIVEHRHHRRDGRDRHFLEGRHAGRAVAMGNLEDAARLLRERRRRRADSAISKPRRSHRSAFRSFMVIDLLRGLAGESICRARRLPGACR